MRARLVVKPNLCTGCRTCELACAFAYSENGKPGRSRIYPLDGGFREMWTPVVCLQCEDAACMKSCLVDALKRNEETGAIELNQDKCVKCGACEAACPFGCTLHDTVHDRYVKCDLCKGDPVCAHFCPTKALTFVPIVEKRTKMAG